VKSRDSDPWHEKRAPFLLMETECKISLSFHSKKAPTHLGAVLLEGGRLLLLGRPACTAVKRNAGPQLSVEQPIDWTNVFLVRVLQLVEQLSQFGQVQWHRFVEQNPVHRLAARRPIERALVGDVVASVCDELHDLPAAHSHGQRAALILQTVQIVQQEAHCGPLFVAALLVATEGRVVVGAGGGAKLWRVADGKDAHHCEEASYGPLVAQTQRLGGARGQLAVVKVELDLGVEGAPVDEMLAGLALAQVLRRTTLHSARMGARPGARCGQAWATCCGGRRVELDLEEPVLVAERPARQTELSLARMVCGRGGRHAHALVRSPSFEPAARVYKREAHCLGLQ